MNEELEMRVRTLLGGLARRDLAELGADDDLIEHLGLDSLQGLSFLAAVEKRFEVRFPDERLGELRTVRALVEALRASAGVAP